MSISIRTRYDIEGIYGTYNGEDPYINPHMKDILQLVNDLNLKSLNILDLCAGNGEISNLLKSNNIVCGNDPYMAEIYKQNTGLECSEYFFKDISMSFDQKYDAIICSYALHLCEDSYLSNVLYNLKFKQLIVLSPSDVILDKVQKYSSLNLEARMKLNRTHMFIFTS